MCIILYLGRPSLSVIRRRGARLHSDEITGLAS